jgi:hypothetical protein
MRSLYCVSVVPGFTVIKPISTWGGGAVGVVPFGKKAMMAATAAAKPPIATTTRFAPVNTETIVASGPVRGADATARRVTRCFAGERRSRFLRVPTDPRSLRRRTADQGAHGGTSPAKQGPGPRPATVAPNIAHGPRNDCRAGDFRCQPSVIHEVARRWPSPWRACSPHAGTAHGGRGPSTYRSFATSRQ